MADENQYAPPRTVSVVAARHRTSWWGLFSALFSWTIVAILWGLVLVVIYGDIGLDLPGRFGLMLDHFVVICIAYLVLLGTGLVIAIVRGRLGLGVALVGSAVLQCWWLVWFFMSGP